jgi:hypothetical protein
MVARVISVVGINIGKNSFHVVELDTVADRQQELGGRNGSRDRSLTSSKKDWSVS